MDIEVRADDELLRAADDEQCAIRFLACQVAGIQSAVGVDRLRGQLGVPEIPAHHVGTAHPQLTRHARGHVMALRIDDPDSVRGASSRVGVTVGERGEQARRARERGFVRLRASRTSIRRATVSVSAASVSASRIMGAGA